LVQKFISGIENEGSRSTSRHRLLWFDRFCDIFCKCEPLAGTGKVIERIKLFKHERKDFLNPYMFLDDYKTYFLDMNRSAKKRPIVVRTIKHRVDTATDLIQYFTGLAIDRKILKKMLRYGRIEEREPYTLDRETEIIKLLTKHFNYRLTVFLHLLLVVGARPIEACRLKVSNVDLTSNPPKVHFPAKITKIKKARSNELTGELAQILKAWLDHKYRTRNKVTLLNEKTETGAKSKTETITPNKNDEDLLFSMSTDGTLKPDSIYNQLQKNFQKLLVNTRLDMTYEDGIHKITFSSCRDYVKTCISNTGNTDFANYWIGHKPEKYNYWTSSGNMKIDEKTRTELFRKVEHLLIYLDKDQVIEVTQDLKSRADIHKKEIENLKHQLTETQEAFEKVKQEKSHDSTLLAEVTSRLAKMEQLIGARVVKTSHLSGDIPPDVKDVDGWFDKIRSGGIKPEFRESHEELRTTPYVDGLSADEETLGEEYANLEVELEDVKKQNNKERIKEIQLRMNEIESVIETVKV